MRQIIKLVIVGFMAFSNIIVPEKPSHVSYNNSVNTETSVYDFDDMEKNSIALLNYLTVLGEKVVKSNNNRILLEDVYSSLFNNLQPNMIDYDTLEYVLDFSKTIDGFRSLSKKRERIQDID